MNTSCEVKCDTYEAFKRSFPCHGDKLFDYIYDHYPEVVQVKKRHVATSNLKKLFEAAFKISSKIGFHEMSLRDLSRETGISMGSIYACISKKDNLAIIVKDMVAQISVKNIQAGQRAPDARLRLDNTIRLNFYTSCLLQPWFSFLYLETRSLPDPHQADSMQIEADIILNFESLIENGVKEGVFHTHQGSFIAHTLLALLQDWYLKPWKHKQRINGRETYLSELLQLLHTLLGSTQPAQ